jgi:hypothetical protein
MMRPPAQALPSFAPGRDYPPRDVALAIVVASLVMAGSAVLLRLSALGERGKAPEIDPGAGEVVRVTPVLDMDSPLLKLGGAPAKLPEMWQPRPRPPAAPARAGKEPGRAPAVSPEASPSSQAVHPAESGAPGAGTPGPGSPEGVPGGTETDPLKARALDVYRARIISWFSSRFRVTGSGLPQSTLTALAAHATVQVGADRTVTGYTLTPSGNAVFDAAARAALESARGSPIPPPPENYPDLAQTQISLTFRCKEGRCD